MWISSHAGGNKEFFRKVKEKKITGKIFFRLVSGLLGHQNIRFIGYSNQGVQGYPDTGILLQILKGKGMGVF